MPPKPRRPDGLKLSLHGGTLLGLPQAGLPDRTFTRGQGCWNCVNAKPAGDRWFEKRSQKLTYATQIALQALGGEGDPVVVKIRREIERFDGLCARQEMFVCDTGRTADGQPVGDFVSSAFLCDRWSGRVGASLARADDGRLDDLPEELRDKIDGSVMITNKPAESRRDVIEFSPVSSDSDLNLPSTNQRPPSSLLDQLDADLNKRTAATNAAFSMPIQDVFTVFSFGVIVTGRIEHGAVKYGDALEVVGLDGLDGISLICAGVESARKLIDQGRAGDTVAVLLRAPGAEIEHGSIARGMLLRSPTANGGVA